MRWNWLDRREREDEGSDKCQTTGIEKSGHGRTPCDPKKGVYGRPGRGQNSTQVAPSLRARRCGARDDRSSRRFVTIGGIYAT